MKKLVKYLTAIFITVVLILFFKNEFSYRLLYNENYGMPALIKKGNIDNLFIGSSMFRQGLDIDIIDTNGEDNYILAYNGNQPVLEYYELTNLIEQDVAIDTVYVDMYAYTMCAAPKISDEKMLMEIGLRDKWNLWKVISKNNEDVDRKTFWQLFVNSNNELLLTWPLNKQIINSKFCKGGNTTKMEASSEEKLMSFEVPKPDGEINPVQLEYTRKMIELAKSRGIRMIYVESPKYGTLAENGDYLNIMKIYAEFLDGEEIDYILCDKTWNAIGNPENVKHYEYNHFNAVYFVDTGHLSYEGRVSFSERIITQ